MSSLEHLSRAFWAVAVIAIFLALAILQVTKWEGFDISPMLTEIIFFAIALPILTLAIERMKRQ